MRILPLLTFSGQGRKAYHGVGKRRRNSYHHPPQYTQREVSPLAAHQTADQPPIQLGHVETDQGPDNQEHTVADKQPQLLAPPSRYDDLQKSQQILEELPVQFHPLPRRRLTQPCPGSGTLASFGLSYGSRFLLRDGISDPVDQGDEEREVYGTRYSRAMAEVDAGEV